MFRFRCRNLILGEYVRIADNACDQKRKDGLLHLNSDSVTVADHREAAIQSELSLASIPPLRCIRVLSDCA